MGCVTHWRGRGADLACAPGCLDFSTESGWMILLVFLLICSLCSLLQVSAALCIHSFSDLHARRHCAGKTFVRLVFAVSICLVHYTDVHGNTRPVQHTHFLHLRATPGIACALEQGDTYRTKLTG